MWACELLAGFPFLGPILAHICLSYIITSNVTVYVRHPSRLFADESHPRDPHPRSGGTAAYLKKILITLNDWELKQENLTLLWSQAASCRVRVRKGTLVEVYQAIMVNIKNSARARSFMFWTASCSFGIFAILINTSKVLLGSPSCKQTSSVHYAFSVGALCRHTSCRGLDSVRALQVLQRCVFKMLSRSVPWVLLKQ